MKPSPCLFLMHPPDPTELPQVDQAIQQTSRRGQGGAMTLDGAVNKTLLLLLVAAATGCSTWVQVRIQMAVSYTHLTLPTIYSV